MFNRKGIIVETLVNQYDPRGKGNTGGRWSSIMLGEGSQKGYMHGYRDRDYGRGEGEGH